MLQLVMQKYDDAKDNRDLSQHVANIYRFSMTGTSEGAPEFHFGDFPFAISVFCQKTNRGHIAAYWVSGRRYQDDLPRLVLTVATGINETDSKLLEGAVNQIWEERLQEVAFASALVGGITPAPQIADMTKRERHEMLSFHLDAHDRFASEIGERKKSKVEQTAIWHNLIRSLGVKQTQQIIAQHEWVRDLSEPGMTAEEFENRESQRTSHINQRLQLARKQGLLIPPSERHNISAKGRKKDEPRRT